MKFSVIIIVLEHMDTLNEFVNKREHGLAKNYLLELTFFYSVHVQNFPQT